MRGRYTRPQFLRGVKSNLVVPVGLAVLLSAGVSASADPDYGMTAELSEARQWTAQACSGVVTVPLTRDIVSDQCQPAGSFSRAAGGALSATSQPVVDGAAYHMPGITTLAHLKLTGEYDPETERRVNRLANAVLAHLRDDAPITAHRLLASSDTTDLLDGEDLAALRVRVAAGLLYDGEDDAARHLAEASLDAVPSSEAAWIAGLAAYRSRDYSEARLHFAAMYDAAAGEPWSSSAAAFWAARAATLSGNQSAADKWLARAAAAKTTFYGIMAARSLGHSDAKDYDIAAWPIPRWKPQSGFTVDPALIYAIARQESRFDPEAESDAGAIGLMQLMPQTAKQMGSYKTERKTNDKNTIENALYDPETNLELGQRYVHTLLTHADIGGNLITMAVAYNGGPGNLARWRKSMNADNDPLFFLETIPAGETRGFIEQVLTNYWIYRIRLGESTESMSDLAAGKWPRYPRYGAPPLINAKPTILASLIPASYRTTGND